MYCTVYCFWLKIIILKKITKEVSIIWPSVEFEKFQKKADLYYRWRLLSTPMPKWKWIIYPVVQSFSKNWMLLIVFFFFAFTTFVSHNEIESNACQPYISSLDQSMGIISSKQGFELVCCFCLCYRLVFGKTQTSQHQNISVQINYCL